MALPTHSPLSLLATALSDAQDTPPGVVQGLNTTPSSASVAPRSGVSPSGASLVALRSNVSPPTVDGVETRSVVKQTVEGKSEDANAPGNVLTFDSPIRPQDLVLKLMLEGKGYDDICELTGLSRAQVEKLAECEWTKRQIDEEARKGNLDSLRALVRTTVFKSAIELRKILDMPIGPFCTTSDKLKAIRISLEFSITPAKDADFGGKRRPEGTPDEAQKRLTELQLQIEQKRNQLARPL